jgi:small subunit ribosomal protein S18
MSIEKTENKKPAFSADDKGKKNIKRIPKRKVCLFCQDKSTFIDYKDVNKLRRFVTEKGKIVPKRMSGTCSKHQIALAAAIKRARIVALLPFVTE